jgi:hypothetical protein
MGGFKEDTWCMKQIWILFLRGIKVNLTFLTELDFFTYTEVVEQINMNLMHKFSSILTNRLHSIANQGTGMRCVAQLSFPNLAKQ